MGSLKMCISVMKHRRTMVKDASQFDRGPFTVV